MPWISVEMPTSAFLRASLDEANTILGLIFASSGDHEKKQILLRLPASPFSYSKS